MAVPERSIDGEFRSTKGVVKYCQKLGQLLMSGAVIASR